MNTLCAWCLAGGQRPSHHLTLDYGLPPEHPVNRGAAPDADAHALIKRVKRQQWTEFGLPRKRHTGGVIGRIKP